ncbi:MAG: hypothetical protein JXA14_23905 [Anaerolineae bacterium]|nr:hypothetical protein [Anaerolineae bacterium]
MDHIKILKRAFKITWDYKALWIFGIILALTVASGGGGGNGGGSSSAPPEPNRPPLETPGTIELPGGEEIEIPQTPEELEAIRGTLFTIGTIVLVGCGVCCCLFIVWIVVWTVLRYVAETALIRMVDDYEETGQKHGIRAGFKLGWSRTSFRLFLIDLVIGVGSLVVFLPLIVLMLALIGLSVLMFTQEVIVLGVIIVVAAVGLFFLTIFFGIIVGVVIELLKPFFQRACVLERLGVGESLGRSFGMMKRHFAWDVAIMWLLVIGLNIGWIIAMFIVGLLLLLVALIVAAVPALVVGGLIGLIFGWIAGLVVGILIGGLIFAILMFVTTTFLQGLRMTFLSTLWTLTYRELLAIEGLDKNEKEPWESDDSHELH